MPSEKKAETSTAKKVLRVIGNILIWIFVIFAALITVLAFAAQANNDGIPTIFNRAVLIVETDSMKGPKGFEAGDIIIGEKLGPEGFEALKEGDVITFEFEIDGNPQTVEYNSHRIVKKTEVEKGNYTFVTRGDNSETNFADDAEISWQIVKTKWTGVRIPKLGGFLKFLQTKTGFLVVIVLPLVAFFIYELIVFIRKFLKVKNAGKKQITAADEELIKQKAIEEYLKSQQSDAAPEAPEAPEAAPEAPEAAPEAPEAPEAPAEEKVEE